MRSISALGRAGIDAAFSVGAAIGACATMWWVAVGIGAGYTTALLSTVIALTLSRRTFASRAEFVRSSAVLPIVGLVAAGVGWLLVAVPVVGAIAFVAGMSVPIWMRRYGERAARLGTLITLPFSAILIAPAAPPQTGMWWADLGMLVLASFVAILWVWSAREVGALIPGGSRSSGPDLPRDDRRARRVGTTRGDATRANGARLAASTRMALQMAVALSVAFAVGWLVFPGHAIWAVLTAFIVCSGNRGRGDVVYKSSLRVAGALVGTVGAVGLSYVVEPTGFGAVVVIFAALFVGTWLRQLSYAFWALTITLVLTMLQGVLGVAPVPGPGAGASLLLERMAAIVLGALIGIAASWFVLPVRSSDVFRKRLSEVLLAVTGVFAPPSADPGPSRAERVAALRASVGRLDQLSPAHRAHRMLGGPRRRRRRTRAFDCIEVALRLPDAVDARLAVSRDGDGGAREQARSRLREAIGDARRSLAAPADFDRILAAVTALVEELDPPRGVPAGSLNE
ncbi:FUSC family protein [Leifsonia poae]|uniref:FUSC family protein n=1 Tax=Leifsonia poae TaxID=110933 RepID=UPI003D66E491